VIVDKAKGDEMDISHEYQLEQFQTVMYDQEDDKIYLIANKLDG
jgi:hypothetical protein